MNLQEKRKVALKSTLLASMPTTTAETLLDAASCSSHGRGETLFLQGESATAIHVVLSGWVKLYRISPNGSEAVVGVFTKGDSIAEAVALRGGSYPVSADAVSNCEVMHIPSTALIALLGSDPQVAINFIASIFMHLKSLVAQIEQMKAQTGAQRLAEFLLELSPRADGSCVVELPYDKVLIAGRLGMKPESLSRAFQKLRTIGVTTDRQYAAIQEVSRLRDYCQGGAASVWSEAL